MQALIWTISLAVLLSACADQQPKRITKAKRGEVALKPTQLKANECQFTGTAAVELEEINNFIDEIDAQGQDHKLSAGEYKLKGVHVVLKKAEPENHRFVFGGEFEEKNSSFKLTSACFHQLEEATSWQKLLQLPKKIQVLDNTLTVSDSDLAVKKLIFSAKPVDESDDTRELIDSAKQFKITAGATATKSAEDDENVLTLPVEQITKKLDKGQVSHYHKYQLDNQQITVSFTQTGRSIYMSIKVKPDEESSEFFITASFTNANEQDAESKDSEVSNKPGAKNNGDRPTKTKTVRRRAKSSKRR